MIFSGIIGHARLKEVLLRMVNGGRLPHALIFVGPESVGKSTTAEALMHNILGHSADLSLHPDFLRLGVLVDEKTGKRKTQIGVEQVRELVGRLGLSSFSNGAKVVWIEHADLLSIGAVNALLKTLEEPKGRVHFILRAGSTEVLPSTVVSRCQVLRFGIVSRQQIMDGLIKMGFAKEDAQTAVAQSLGRPGRAIRYLKESTYQAQVATDLNRSITFFSASLPKRLGHVMNLIPKSEIAKTDVLAQMIDQWELVCRDVCLRQLGLQAIQTFPDSRELDQLANRFSFEDLLSIFHRLREVRLAMNHHVNPHLSLEHIALY